MNVVDGTDGNAGYIKAYSPNPKGRRRWYRCVDCWFSCFANSLGAAEAAHRRLVEICPLPSKVALDRGDDGQKSDICP